MGMAKTGRKLFRCGCLGCLGLILVGILISVVVGGLAWLGARSEQIEDQELTQGVPAGPVQAEQVSPELAGTISGELQAIAAAGLVVLDLEDGEFQIEPGEPGEPIRIEATYDVNDFTLEKTYTPVSDGQEKWQYQVSFRRTSGSFLVAAIKQAITGSVPRIRIWLPPDIPIDLEMQLAKGGAQIDLSGMWLVNTELGLEMGGAELEIDEPLRAPAEQIKIRSGMGGCMLSGLGNASPKRLEIEYRMGGTVVDLEGEWANDAEVLIRGSMGGCTVLVPDNVRLARGLEVQPTEEVDGRPVLRIETKVNMGEIEIIQ
jgi:hypothetical protein